MKRAYLVVAGFLFSACSTPVEGTNSYLLSFKTATSCADAIAKTWTVRLVGGASTVELDTPSTTVIIPMGGLSDETALPALSFPSGWKLGFSCTRKDNKLSCPSDSSRLMIAQVVSTGMTLTFARSLQLLGTMQATFSGGSASGFFNGHVAQVVNSALASDCDAPNHQLTLTSCTEPAGGGPCPGEVIGTLP